LKEKKLRDHENRFKIYWDVIGGNYQQVTGNYYSFQAKQYIVCDFRPKSRTKNLPTNVDKNTCFVIYDDEGFVDGKFIQYQDNGEKDETYFKFVLNVDIFYESVQSNTQ